MYHCMTETILLYKGSFEQKWLLSKGDYLYSIELIPGNIGMIDWLKVDWLEEIHIGKGS